MAAIAALPGCGNGNSSSSTTTTQTAISQGVKNRVLVSDQFVTSGFNSGEVVVVDGQHDMLTSSFASTGGTPARMVLSPDKLHTLVLDQTLPDIYTYDNTTETQLTTTTFSAVPSSAVILADNKTGYAAVRNAGLVSIFDLTAGTVNNNIAVPTVSQLVLSHNANVLLAFSDDSNSLTLIDTTSNTPTVIGGFDRPISAVFTSDDTKAFILSCGFECGGTAARVTVLDIASRTPGNSVAVPGASIGQLDSTGANLFVAGTCANRSGPCAQFGGALSVMNIANTSAPTLTTSVGISNGSHDVMALAGSKLYIGSRTCDNVSFGCLSIFDTGTSSATVDAPQGDVTGLQFITSRNVMYVIEGGLLRILNAATGAPTGTQLDVIGKDFDVKAIDQ